jgi:G3E family GTPase
MPPSDDDDPPDAVPLDAVIEARAPAPAPPPARLPGRPPTPVTLITGALGAGKTTLLNHVLTTAHGYRFAVVLNEAAADAGIEAALVAAAAKKAGATALGPSDWVELANGCLCCATRGEFAVALDALAARDDLDAILVETSGLADPGPAAAALWSDDALEPTARLDGVVAVVDAGRFRSALADPRPRGAVREVARQVAYADVVLLNKTDACCESEREAAAAAVRGINPRATLHATVRSVIDPGLLLGRGTVDPERTAASAARVSGSGGGGSAAPATALALATHAHDDGIVSHAWTTTPGAIDETPLRAWLESVLWADRGVAGAPDIYRMKALLPLLAPGNAPLRKAVLQAVHDTYEIVDCGPWGGEGGVDGDAAAANDPSPPPVARWVAIGRSLDPDALEAGAAGAVVAAR